MIQVSRGVLSSDQAGCSGWTRLFEPLLVCSYWCSQHNRLRGRSTVLLTFWSTFKERKDQRMDERNPHPCRSVISDRGVQQGSAKDQLASLPRVWSSSSNLTPSLVHLSFNDIPSSNQKKKKNQEEIETTMALQLGRSPLLKPVAALAGWTFVMEAWMYATRLPAMSKYGVEPNPDTISEDSELKFEVKFEDGC